MKTEEEKCNFA